MNLFVVIFGLPSFHTKTCYESKTLTDIKSVNMFKQNIKQKLTYKCLYWSDLSHIEIEYSEYLILLKAEFSSSVIIL